MPGRNAGHPNTLKPLERHTREQDTITSPDLPGTVTFDHTDTITGVVLRCAVLLTVEQTARLLDVWCEGRPGTSADRERKYLYSELGLFVTGIRRDTGFEFGCWESASGRDGADQYSTAHSPLPLAAHRML